MTRNYFAVYEHIRPDTGEVFYVGKGTPSRVRHRQRKDNPHHCRILAKLDREGLYMEVRIVADNLPDESALCLEKMRIAMWRAAGVQLVNLTEGGEGISNPSPETRARIAAAKIGNKNAVGAIRSEETRKLLSNALMGRTYSAETIAKQRETKSTPEYKAMASAKMLEVQNRPDVVAKKSAGAKVTHNRPEVKAKKSASSKIAQNRPDVKARKSAAMLIVANDPAVSLKKSIAMKATLARKRALAAQAQGSISL